MSLPQFIKDRIPESYTFKKTFKCDWDIWLMNKIFRRRRTDAVSNLGGNNMKTLIKLYMSKIWIFLKPLIATFLSEAGQKLAEVALYAVTTLAGTSLSSEEKRAEAFKLIVAKLKEEGLELSDSLVNLAIETAVAKLKSTSTASE